MGKRYEWDSRRVEDGGLDCRPWRVWAVDGGFTVVMRDEEALAMFVYFDVVVEKILSCLILSDSF